MSPRPACLPFADGAIPLEAMRLGCEATAISIKPIAWFVLKPTLEYPRRPAGREPPSPRLALATDLAAGETQEADEVGHGAQRV